MGGYGLGTLRLDGVDSDFMYGYEHTQRDFYQGDLDYSYKPYISQVGLQGWIFRGLARLLAKVFPKSINYWFLRGACIGMLDLTLFLICWQLRQRYGTLLAGCFLLASVGSPWIANFAPDLYWVEFTWFVPMLIGVLCLNHPKYSFVWYLLMYLSILIKSLCGYEYISTVMMGAISFMCAEWITQRENRKALTKMIFGIGIACLLGFATALLIHSWIMGEGQIAPGFRKIVDDIALRRMWGSERWKQDKNYTADYMTSVIIVIGKYFWYRVTGKATLAVFLLTGGTLLWQRRHENEKNGFETTLWLVNIFGALSWVVLAKGHSNHHLYINFVLWHMGSMQIALYILTKFICKHKSLLLPSRGDPAKESE